MAAAHRASMAAARHIWPPPSPTPAWTTANPAILWSCPICWTICAPPIARTANITYDSLFEQLRTTPLLILDDLGTQSSTPWAQEKLFQLLNHRYNARLATVITTNQRLDEMEPRLRSRLLDPSLVNHFAITAPDFRAGQEPRCRAS